MARTDISVCARALVELGASPFSSFDDEDDNARALKLIYPEIKSTIIASYPWECMKVRKYLTRLAATPDGWMYSYLMPGDLIGAPAAVFISATDKIGTSRFEVRGREILCDYPEIWAEYTTERPEHEWPAWFANLVTAAVAAAIAFQVTDQQGVKDMWEVKAYGTPSEGGTGGLFGTATTLDAQGSGNIGFVDTAFVDARFACGYPGEVY